MTACELGRLRRSDAPAVEVAEREGPDAGLCEVTRVGDRIARDETAAGPGRKPAAYNSATLDE